MSLGEEHSQSAHEQRYWLSVGDGQTYGPYSVAELNAYAADGRVTTSSQLCADGSNVWISASSVLASASLSGGGPPAPPGPRVLAQGSGRTIGLTWAIVATVASVLFCCLPIGIGAIVYAMKANAKFAMGDEHGGSNDERAYRNWLVVTLVLSAISAAFSVWTVYAALDALSNLTG